MGCRAAAITDGHPSGWIASGAFALIISEILDGWSMRDAVGWKHLLVSVGHRGRGSRSCAQGGTANGGQRRDSYCRDGSKLLARGGWPRKRSRSRSIASGAPRTRRSHGSCGQPLRRQRQHREHHRQHPRGPRWVSVGSIPTCWSSWRVHAVIEQMAGDLCNMFDERTNAAIEWDRYPFW